jgi:RNA polymerase sigma-54 factor
MALETKLYLRQTQKLTITPMLQEAINLLQLSRLELNQLLQKELVENPLLEIEENGAENPATPEAGNSETQAEEERVPEVGEAGRDTPDIDWSSYLEDTSDYRYFQPSEEIERPAWENLASRPISMIENLLLQLKMITKGQEEFELGAYIIGNLDDDGYLRISLEELATFAQKEPAKLEPALTLVQSLEPPGIGARDLKESLLLQLRARNQLSPLLEKLVGEKLETFREKRLEKLALELGAGVEEVKEAINILATLDPRPGRALSFEPTQYIIPDIYVIKIENNYMVMDSDEGMPRLRLSHYYKRLLAQRKNSPERAYVEEKMRSALWLIRSIEQRQRTLHRVAESIVKFQGAFLDHGVSRLRPLTLREVAEDIGMHESTVSRVTTSKYIHTPQGIFELKHFFQSKLAHAQSGVVSSLSVKDIIHQMVIQENPQKPLSDKAIADNLRRQGIEIARRTVAKYREELKIEPSNLRKRMF